MGLAVAMPQQQCWQCDQTCTSHSNLATWLSCTRNAVGVAQAQAGISTCSVSDQIVNKIGWTEHTISEIACLFSDGCAEI